MSDAQQNRRAGAAPRDFRRPKRLAPARLAELARALEGALPALERKLSDVAGLRAKVALAGLAELDADAALAAAGDAPCVLRFRCAKAPAWLVWRPAAAVEALEAVLGARNASGTARRLSPTEARLATQILTELARGVAAPLGVAAADFALIQAQAELGSWRDAGEGAEAHRLEARVALDLGGHASELSLYLPGVEAGAEPALAPLGELPAHLERVEIELSASLPGCEITLDQLLALEEGDVIPLDARLGDPARLGVEGLTVARARLGSHRGRLAVRVERLCVEPEALPATLAR